MYLLNDIMINFRRMNYKIPSLIQYLEKETGYSKGKGDKSSSFISLFEDVRRKRWKNTQKVMRRRVQG